MRVARGGTPHLFHDETLERTTDGSGALRERDDDELGGLDAGSWFDPRFAGEPVPTLERALSRLRGRIGRVYAEIKGYDAPADVDRMVAEVSDAGMLDGTVFISMDWEALARVRARSADTAIGYIVERPERTEEAFRRAAGDPRALVDFDARLLAADPDRVEAAAAAAIALAAWTVNRVDDAARLLEMGVHRITTNEVGGLLAWKATL